MAWVLVWVVGMCVAYGYVGKIRDEMDGILDIFVVVFWPIALGYICIRSVLMLLNRFGEVVRFLLGPDERKVSQESAERTEPVFSPKDESNELVVYGGETEGEFDLFTNASQGQMVLDSRVVMFALIMAKSVEGTNLCNLLNRRGYDVKTLRLTVSKKAPEATAIE